MSQSDAEAPRERALRWWSDRAERNEYVVAREDFPPSAESSYLRRGGYVLEVAGGTVWILARPGIDVLPDAFYANYWQVVRTVLAAYAPAAVERLSAVRLHMDEHTPQRALTAIQQANGSKRVIELIPGFVISLRPATVDAEMLVERRPGGVPLQVEDPAATLLGLPVEFLRSETERKSIWLKSLVVSVPRLEKAYGERPRPVVLKRLGVIAADVGNARLAEQIDQVLRAAYGHRVGRGHTDRGGSFPVPAHVAGLTSALQPWLDRQAATFARFRDVLLDELGEAEARLGRYPRERLRVAARDAKAYDAYHSTTIEGYRIRPEEVSALIRGAPVGGHDPEEVRSRMAVAGYSRAFESTLAEVGDGPDEVPITETLVQKLYVDLFSPSIDAGLLSPELLRGWRTEPAYLRGHLYVPPGPEKLPRMMRQFEVLVNELTGHPLVRAILAHLEFVTVHPYADGNGRIARLLMNVALVGGGLPWVTIRSDERARYFGALHTAQVDGDPLPFGRFVREHAEAATAALVRGENPGAALI